MALTYNTKLLVQSALKTPEAGTEVINAIQNVVKVARIDITAAQMLTVDASIPLSLGAVIPAKAVVVRTYYNVQTTFTDNGTGGGVGLLGITVLVGGAAIIGNTVNSGAFNIGLWDGVQTGLAATMYKLLVDTQINVSYEVDGSATLPVTGAMSVFVEYVQSI